MPYGPFSHVSYACALCRSNKKTAVLTKAGLATGETFSIVRCTACGHIRSDPRIADERLSELYDDAYYRGEGFDRSVSYEGPISQWTRDEHDGILLTVQDALDIDLSGARWLDIGCGSGAFVSMMRARGIEAYGFDDSVAAIASCSRKDVRMLTADALARECGSFDVVSAIEVIEHVADPIAFLTFVASFARPGGVVYIHTENWNVVRHLPGRPYVMPEGHIQYFTPRTMRKMFTACGLSEAAVLDRSWFVWRRLPAAVKRLRGRRVLRMLRALVVRVLPGYAPFPVGVVSPRS